MMVAVMFRVTYPKRVVTYIGVYLGGDCFLVIAVYANRTDFLGLKVPISGF